MKAIIYIRVSTRRQEDEGYSPDEQLESLLKFAKEKGYEVPDDFIIADKGKSGRKQARPGFQKVMELVQAKACDAVIVSELSRFARSVKTTLEAMEEIERKGIDFISKKEAIDTSTATGKLFFHIIAAFAQFFSDSLSERITEAHAFAIEEGRRLGQVPFGYARGENGILIEVKAEQEVIQMVKWLRGRGKTYHEICNVLREMEMKNKSGKVNWNIAQIQRILARAQA